MNEPAEVKRRFYDFSVHDCVRVCGMGVGPADMAAITHALRASLHTASLVLSNVALSAAQIQVLAQALPHSTVRQLQLDFNPLRTALLMPSLPAAPAPAPVPAAGKASGKAAANLSVTTPAHDASGSVHADARPVHVFALLLRRSSLLTQLSLRGNGLGPDDAHHLADALRFNRTLTDLNLGLNMLGDKGATLLADAIRDNRSLRSLSIASNAVTDARYATAMLFVRC
ncbi:MAG: hypothetical protein EOO41_00435 [Methanobacteriota archaeon]|nr:MAG: hypothetical protein EOO41_00435 [Euryarchaeota archaeon]